MCTKNHLSFKYYQPKRGLERRFSAQKLARRLNAPFFAKRYVGNSETKILHDLDRERSECNIDEIPRNRIQMFEWLSIPAGFGYSGCKSCMPDFEGVTKK